MDLNPLGYNDSRISAMTATQQVGDGWVGPMGAIGSVRHALVWSGTADSVVDLNQFLPAGYTHAVATGIDANGNVVGYAYNTPVYGLAVPPDAIAVVFAPGDDSYPLINYEYVVVSSKQTNPTTADALRHFLLWAISADGGNAPKYLDAVGFIPLPTFVRALSENQINAIK